MTDESLQHLRNALAILRKHPTVTARSLRARMFLSHGRSPALEQVLDGLVADGAVRSCR